MAGRTKADASGDARPFLLEAHYYLGGLRIKPLGSGVQRPSWVPANPDAYVGFRDEFALGHGDAVLEFARFAIGGERLTWIGLFFRSVDGVFGDRGNHAGAGVWLRGQRVLDLHALLHGLRLIAGAVAKEGVDAVARDADGFLQERYLPSYIAPATPLPAQLDGWRFSATQFPDTALFLAEEPNEDEAWRLAGEQVARMSILPAAGRAVSRALVLVRASAGGRASGAAKGVETIKSGLPFELIGELPEAIADIAAENRTMAEELRMAKGLGAKTQAELDALRGESAAAKARVAELEAQLSESDVLRRLASIDGRLKEIEDGRRNDRFKLDTVASDLQRLRVPAPSPSTGWGGHQPPEPRLHPRPSRSPIVPWRRAFGGRGAASRFTPLRWCWSR